MIKISHTDSLNSSEKLNHFPNKTCYQKLLHVWISKAFPYHKMVAVSPILYWIFVKQSNIRRTSWIGDVKKKKKKSLPLSPIPSSRSLSNLLFSSADSFLKSSPYYFLHEILQILLVLFSPNFFPLRSIQCIDM